MGSQELMLTGSHLRRKLLQLREDSTYQDVNIVARNKIIPAHKCVLAVGSAFFNVLLNKIQAGPKAGSSGKQDEIHLANLDVSDLACLESVVNFLYTGDIEINDENFATTMKLASYLVMNDLLELCEVYLVQTLTVDNCVQFYVSLKQAGEELGASSHSNNNMVAQTWEMIEANFYTKILTSDAILQVYKYIVLYLYWGES